MQTYAKWKLYVDSFLPLQTLTQSDIIEVQAAARHLEDWMMSQIKDILLTLKADILVLLDRVKNHIKIITKNDSSDKASPKNTPKVVVEGFSYDPNWNSQIKIFLGSMFDTIRK